MENALSIKSAIKALNELQQKGSFVFSKSTVGWDYDQLAWSVRDLLSSLNIDSTYDTSNGSIRLDINGQE